MSMTEHIYDYWRLIDRSWPLEPEKPEDSALDPLGVSWKDHSYIRFSVGQDTRGDLSSHARFGLGYSSAKRQLTTVEGPNSTEDTGSSIKEKGAI